METDQGLQLDGTGMVSEGRRGNCILYTENPKSGNSNVVTGSQARTQHALFSFLFFCENFLSEKGNTSESRD